MLPLGKHLQKFLKKKNQQTLILAFEAKFYFALTHQSPCKKSGS